MNEQRKTVSRSVSSSCSAVTSRGAPTTAQAVGQDARSRRSPRRRGHEGRRHPARAFHAAPRSDAGELLRAPGTIEAAKRSTTSTSPHRRLPVLRAQARPAESLADDRRPRAAHEGGPEEPHRAARAPAPCLIDAPSARSSRSLPREQAAGGLGLKGIRAASTSTSERARHGLRELRTGDIAHALYEQARGQGG